MRPRPNVIKYKMATLSVQINFLSASLDLFKASNSVYTWGSMIMWHHHCCSFHFGPCIGLTQNWIALEDLALRCFILEFHLGKMLKFKNIFKFKTIKRANKLYTFKESR